MRAMVTMKPNDNDNEDSEENEDNDENDNYGDCNHNGRG